MAGLRIEGLPADPLAAAADFHARIVPLVRIAAGSGEDLGLVFPVAPFAHEDWRRAAVASLARALAPVRINGLVSDDAAAIAAALAYCDAAPGLTGQILTLDGESAGAVV
jgi:hypothetical protein